MQFMDRLTSLMKADAHGVVDAVEDRALMLRQHLREAETELRHKRARAEALAAEEKELGEEAERLKARIEELDEDVNLALTSGKEELARFSIKKLLPLRQAVERARERRERVSSERQGLETKLAEQEKELQDLKLRARGYLARLGAEGQEDGSVVDPVVADEEVEMELLRRRQAAGAADAAKEGR